MTPAAVAKEILELLNQLEERGGPRPSEQLRAFLRDLAESPGLKKPVRKSGRSSRRAPPIRGARKTGPKPDMSKTITDLAERLRAVFESDEQFESVLGDPAVQKLSKPNVVTLYNTVFEAPRPLSKSLTKPDLLNAIRRERINHVRGRS